MEILLEEIKHKKAKHQDVEEKKEVNSDIRVYTSVSKTAMANLLVAYPAKSVLETRKAVSKRSVDKRNSSACKSFLCF